MHILPVVNLLVCILWGSGRSFQNLVMEAPYLGLDFGALPQQYRKLPNVLERMLVCCTGVGNVNLGRRILHEVDER